ncbi:hypothetical protein CKO44_02925 [Rubrivivax gelatinosus]|uniref:glycosyltransferase n=1 Tax=Rubrivivax gelatinosus TaxID=28068 RepID=UPI001903CEBD|nr:glycosyltransferase [Rubrivivax gelatinosus]MBK1612418.1 hypothetical protein [Rubrivivax gelatinosus]MBZ8142834.1 hypothetical protein [Rubrivivax gelatinosus]
MTPSPCVALLMATYGRDDPKHLSEALDHLARQTYPHQRMRLLLAIDGPIPESNRQVIGAFQASSSIKTVATEIPRNSGLARALNAAATKLSGEDEYVLRVDADDLCHPDRVLLQVEQLQADVTVGILGSAIEEFESSGATLGVRTYPRRDQVRDYIVKASPLAHPTVCFRRNAWDALGGYRDVAFNEDLDMWFRALTQGIVIDNLAQPLLRYRISEGFYSRRSWSKAFAEYRCYTIGLYRLFGISWRLAVPAARLAIRLMPRAVARVIYSGRSWRRRMLNV